MLDKKLKVNKDARPDSGISYIEEKAIVESRDGKRGVVEVFLEYSVSDVGLPVTKILLSQEDFRQVELDLDKGTNLTFDDENGVGEFTSRGKRYRIRAFQDFDNNKIQAVEPEEDEKD